MTNFKFYDFINNPILFFSADFSEVIFKNKIYNKLFETDRSLKIGQILKNELSKLPEGKIHSIDGFFVEKINYDGVEYYRCTYQTEFTNIFPKLKDLNTSEKGDNNFGSWFFHTQESIVYWSKNIFQIFDYENQIKEDEYITTDDFYKFLHPEDVDRVAKAIGDLINESKHIKDLEYRIVVSNKTIKYIKSESILIEHVEGKVSRVVGLSQDVTEERSIEVAKANFLKDLNKSNSALSEFAHNASHDLQEPLRKIEAYTNRLVKSLGENVNEQTTKYTEKLIGATQRMSDLINDILKLSRLSASNQETSVIELNDVIGEIIGDYEISIKETNTTIDYDLPKVSGVKTQLYQLFQNLIGNAIKFRLEGVNPHIELSYALVDNVTKQNNNLKIFQEYYCITVKDNGIGFESKFADVIFEPFKRLYGRSEFKGTGIGLAICKKVVDNHNGAIVALSEEGKGAIFNIYLPI
jgi:signal transduction histidine kinase